MVPELMPQTHRLAPVSHRAFRILLFGRDKSLLRLLVPERMLQRDSLFKSLLRLSRARHRKMHRPQLVKRNIVMMMFIIAKSQARNCRRQNETPDQLAHNRNPLGVYCAERKWVNRSA